MWPANMSLRPQDVCRLLDEDGVFSPEDEVILDTLQHKASQHFRQDLKRQEKKEKLLLPKWSPSAFRL